MQRTGRSRSPRSQPAQERIRSPVTNFKTIRRHTFSRAIKPDRGNRQELKRGVEDFHANDEDGSEEDDSEDYSEEDDSEDDSEDDGEEENS